MTTEFVIYTDESVKDGAYFSNFYGGILVRSRDLKSVCETLADAKARQNMHGEIKWTKVTGNYEAVIAANKNPVLTMLSSVLPANVP